MYIEINIKHLKLFYIIKSTYKYDTSVGVVVCGKILINTDKILN